MLPLILEYIRKQRPLGVLLENVAGLLNHGEVLEGIVSEFLAMKADNNSRNYEVLARVVTSNTETQAVLLVSLCVGAEMGQGRRRNQECGLGSSQLGVVRIWAGLCEGSRLERGGWCATGQATLVCGGNATSKSATALRLACPPFLWRRWRRFWRKSPAITSIAEV